MRATSVTCAACGKSASEEARYCPHCGEPLDAQLVADLRRLHSDLRALDRLIAEGHGAQSVAATRTEVLRRYVALRRAPDEAQSPTTNAQGPAEAPRKTVEAPSGDVPGAESSPRSLGD